MKILILGAGLIGACLAYRLTRAGCAVTVVEGATPASGASGSSFGWINASFYLNPAHHHLRVAHGSLARGCQPDKAGAGVAVILGAYHDAVFHKLIDELLHGLLRKRGLFRKIPLPNTVGSDVDQDISARLGKPAVTCRRHGRDEILAPGECGPPQGPADVFRNHPRTPIIVK